MSLLVLGLWAVLPGAAHAAQADEAATAAYRDLEFIISSFSLLVWGALVMWMCAGFTMLESGSVRTKNASMICLKNVGIFSIAVLAYYAVGYNLMYVDVDGVIGTLRFFHGPTAAERTLFDAASAASSPIDEIVGRGHASMSGWFFQSLFVATTASIVSGTILERVKLWAFWAFTLVLTALIYPIAGAWAWGGGWLEEMGFQDFAGGTVVHVTGGCAALAALLIVGPRRGKFRPDGSVKATPPSNVLVVTLGVLILWLGWFGFNGGSQLALSTPGDAVTMSSVLANTNLAAASGLVAAVLVARPLFGRLGLASSLNGALAGLVSITAGPNIAETGWAVVIGAVGGLLCSGATKLMERLKLDDVVGAIPVHLVAGTWGTLAASIAAGADLGVQLAGVGSVAAFTFVASFIVWKVIDLTVGVRVSRDIEYVGQDVGELGIESHPEFVLVPEEFDDYQRPLRSRDRRGRRRGRRDRAGRPGSDRPMDPRLAVPPEQSVLPGAGQPAPRPSPPPGEMQPGQFPPPGAGQPAPRPSPPPGEMQPGQFPPRGAGQPAPRPSPPPGRGQPRRD
jgi:Amt family ammonium transporter